MKFIARKHKGLRIVLDPRVRIKDMGRSITQSLTGQTKLGLTIEFHDGIYDTNDKEVIKALKNHPGFGLEFFNDEPVPVTPTVEAAAAENEKKGYAEEIRSTCTECGKKFANETQLNVHMRTHESK